MLTQDAGKVAIISLLSWGRRLRRPSGDLPPEGRLRRSIIKLMRGKWLLVGGVTVLAAIAAGALSVRWRDAAAKRKLAQVPSPASVFQNAEVSLTGRIQAQKLVPVGAPVEGVIDSYLVDVGQEVYAGQLLGRIRSGRLDAAVEQATAEAEQAQNRVNNLDGALIAARLDSSRSAADAARAHGEMERAEKVYLRQQMLYREGATPRLVFEKAERDYKGAKAESDNLEAVAKTAQDRVAQLSKQMDAARVALSEKNEELDHARTDAASAELRAPADGLVLGRRGQPGEQVDPAMLDLFQIAVDLTALEVILEPEPPVLARIRTGQPAAVRVAEFPNQELSGKVQEVRGTQVIVDFLSPSPVIRPGLTAQVRIKLT